jgi:glutamate-1-semialdehyde 2,1-aminomutase
MTNQAQEAQEELAGPHVSPRSHALFERAKQVLPGGNTRHTVCFRPFPVYARSGSGCHVTDEDGVRRIDFVNNYTSLIHGHAHPVVTQAIEEQVRRLVAVGLPTANEVELAELLVERLVGVEQVRFANSGTEAVMMAIKAARAFTGRQRIAKVEGADHGGYDHAEIGLRPDPDAWGDAAAPVSTRGYPGQPASIAEDVVLLPWGDAAAAGAILDREGLSLAAVLFDPLPSRLAYAELDPAFLEVLEDARRRHGLLLLADEVYSLRLGFNGAQGRYGFVPDLTAMGKIIGGGLPVGAVGGRRDVMSVFDLTSGGPAVLHGGTFNANPATMAAGLAAMQLYTPAAVARLDELGDRLRRGLKTSLAAANRPGQVAGRGSLTALSLSDRPIRDYRSLRDASQFDALQPRGKPTLSRSHMPRCCAPLTPLCQISVAAWSSPEFRPRRRLAHPVEWLRQPPGALRGQRRAARLAGSASIRRPYAPAPAQADEETPMLG